MSNHALLISVLFGALHSPSPAHAQPLAVPVRRLPEAPTLPPGRMVIRDATSWRALFAYWAQLGSSDPTLPEPGVNIDFGQEMVAVLSYGATECGMGAETITRVVREGNDLIAVIGADTPYTGLLQTCAMQLGTTSLVVLPRSAGGVRWVGARPEVIIPPITDFIPTPELAAAFDTADAIGWRSAWRGLPGDSALSVLAARALAAHVRQQTCVGWERNAAAERLLRNPTVNHDLQTLGELAASGMRARSVGCEFSATVWTSAAATLYALGVDSLARHSVDRDLVKALILRLAYNGTPVGPAAALLDNPIVGSDSLLVAPMIATLGQYRRRELCLRAIGLLKAMRPTNTPPGASYVDDRPEQCRGA